MTAVYSQVRTSIRNVALAALSEFTSPVVIFSNSNGLEPAESYCVVNILNIQQIGHHNTSTKVDLNSQLSIQVVYECLCQFSFVGSLAGDMVQSFTQRINNNPLTIQELKRNKLSIMRKSQTRRAPQVRDTKWIEYQTLDVTFSYIVNTLQVIDTVEGVVIQQNIDNTSEIIKIPESITYP
jgi:hypothetical protein